MGATVWLQPRWQSRRMTPAMQAPVDNSAQEAAHLRTTMLRVQQLETARDTQQVSTVFRRRLTTLTAWRKEVSSAEDEDEVSPLFLELLQAIVPDVLGEQEQAAHDAAAAAMRAGGVTLGVLLFHAQACWSARDKAGRVQ